MLLLLLSQSVNCYFFAAFLFSFPTALVNCNFFAARWLLLFSFPIVIGWLLPFLPPVDCSHFSFPIAVAGVNCSPFSFSVAVAINQLLPFCQWLIFPFLFSHAIGSLLLFATSRFASFFFSHYCCNWLIAMFLPPVACSLFPIAVAIN